MTMLADDATSVAATYKRIRCVEPKFRFLKAIGNATADVKVSD